MFDHLKLKVFCIKNKKLKEKTKTGRYLQQIITIYYKTICQPTIR